LANIVQLEVVASAGLAGDYNNDGVVNAADYVVWRETDGSSSGYSLWRANFGELASVGSGSVGILPTVTLVPEPASFVLLMVAAAGWHLLQRRIRC
jgi:hypothetical protein